MGERASDEIILQAFRRQKPDEEVIAKPRNLKKRKTKEKLQLKNLKRLCLRMIVKVFHDLYSMGSYQ